GVRHFDGLLLSSRSSNYWNDFIFGQATPEDHATHNDWFCVMRSAIPVGRNQRQIGGYSASRGWGGSGGVGFEPEGAEVVAGGEAHVGVECGGQAP
ncbi:MAG: hypothetical protein QOG05_2856, partial [Streptosporangiaceae bacterium]|nr:hypothetical protein [Streptosporangiaceae bacterium]